MRARIPASLRSPVPYMRDSAIEAEAEVLLAEYGLSHGRVLEPPIPVEKILEIHLQLSFDLMDLQKELGLPNVLGALWVDTARIGVDRSLDPVLRPAKEGRYNFTLGHEIGHWRLHRKYFLADRDQAQMGDRRAAGPSYICRDGAKDRVEMQANSFSAYLLMPTVMLRAAWQDMKGDDGPLVLEDIRRNQPDMLGHEVLLRRHEPACDEEADDMILEGAARPLARLFKVSPSTMRIRLEGQSLLCRKRPDPQLFN
jgi:hypothetical protein